MKLKVGKISLLFRLGAVAGALLFGQQALAIGTAVNTPIANTATVAYEVNSVGQTDLVSTVTFVVDRRVDFTLVELGIALVDVTPGETDAFFEFRLTNDSNSPLDFSFLLAELVGGTVRGVPDTGTMTGPGPGIVVYAVSASPASGTDDIPLRTGPQFVDQLAPDDSIRIGVFGDAATDMLNGQVAGVQLDATAREPATSGTGVLAVGGPNGDLTVENVFADADNDGVEVNTDGFNVVSAALVVTKSYVVIDDGLLPAPNSGLPIPGATVEYTILIENLDALPVVAEDADLVVMTDVIDLTNVTLNLNVLAYGGEDVSVVNGAAPALTCNVESNVDGDGCDLDVVAQTGTLTILDVAEVPGSITVLGNTTLTILYQVTIDDTDPTP